MVWGGVTGRLRRLSLDLTVKILRGPPPNGGSLSILRMFIRPRQLVAGICPTLISSLDGEKR